jgi:two-component system nitrogen regulation response regulator NtrX
MEKESILVVDDEASVRKTLSGILEDEGYDVLIASDGLGALDILSRQPVDLVLLDIWMPGIDGLETLNRINEFNFDSDVIIISGHGNVETAVKATKLGAFDFIEKPLSLDKTLLIVRHALDQRKLEQENRDLKLVIEKKYEIIGNSPAIRELKNLISSVAPSTGRVLIFGENGTGKELVARQIHLNSQRSGKPFKEVNCAAIPDDLIESELFGHEKGSFTGATQQRTGKFEQANSGTIFLDEVGDMSMKTQAKVLRVLEEQVVERLGGKQPIPIDVRVIAASNKDLEDEIQKGNFREDLYFRLNVIPIYVPPLREHIEDIAPLTHHFLKQFSIENGKKVKQIDKTALDALKKYHWPGNIRELKNSIERLVITVPNDTITAHDIPPSIFRRPTAKYNEQETPKFNSLKEVKEYYEKEWIQKQLHLNNMNIKRTAEKLGIERSNLYRKIKAHHIDITQRNLSKKEKSRE